MIFKELHTERLLLRQLTPETYDFIHTTIDDNTLMEFLGLSTAEELQKEKDKYRKGLTTHNRKFCNFQLIDKASGRVIGGCGFHTWYIDHMRAEIGYGLTDDSFKQKGLMSEALLPILKYGFEQMGLHRIEAFIGPENIASQKLITNFNFKKEGVMREHYVVKGIPQDSLVFGLLKHEFKL